MNDCFNNSCPFRVNETSNVNRCDSISYPNRCNNNFTIYSNRTLTNDELATIETHIKEDKKIKYWNNNIVDIFYVRFEEGEFYK